MWGTKLQVMTMQNGKQKTPYLVEKEVEFQQKHQTYNGVQDLLA